MNSLVRSAGRQSHYAAADFIMAGVQGVAHVLHVLSALAVVWSVGRLVEVVRTSDKLAKSCEEKMLD
jgi:hypothetical protein